MRPWVGAGLFVALLLGVEAGPAGEAGSGQAPGQAQTPAAPPARPAPPSGAQPATPPGTPGVQPPADYVIGPEDVLAVLFWRDKDLSADNVAVRPDGKISLPLLNDVDAAGLTPDQLRDRITEAAKQYVEDPTVTVIVKVINSRKVFVTGQVLKPGPYPIAGPTTVLQMLALAGGLSEFADSKKIAIMRSEGGKTVSLRFNYNDVVKGKNLQQNILLKPGDTIVVPD
jgi:polysaccharide export outer membrane protein